MACYSHLITLNNSNVKSKLGAINYIDNHSKSGKCETTCYLYSVWLYIIPIVMSLDYIFPGLDGRAPKMWRRVWRRGEVRTSIWILSQPEGRERCHGVCDGKLPKAQRGLRDPDMSTALVSCRNGIRHWSVQQWSKLLAGG